jgi:hypothetical protein
VPQATESRTADRTWLSLYGRSYRDLQEFLDRAKSKLELQNVCLTEETFEFPQEDVRYFLRDEMAAGNSSAADV